MSYLRKGIGIVILGSLLIIGWWIRTRPDPVMENRGGSDFRFRDATASLGIDFHYEDPKLPPPLADKERIFIVGGGVAVADVNSDGWMDVLLVTAKKGSKNHLYLNEEGKKFREAASEWGISDTNDRTASMVPTFFDADNDGKPDLYITGLGCSRFFRNVGNHFEEASKESHLTDCRNGIGASPLDVDDDGLLDLYVLRYWGPQDLLNPTTPFVWTENVFDSKNGGRESLYGNRGEGTFEEFEDQAGGRDPHWSYDAAVADLDGDGVREIFLANDFGPDALFGIREARLVDESDRLGVPDRRQGMSVSIGDIDHDGRPHIYVSNIFEKKYHQEANFLWKFGPSGKISDEAETRKVDNCGWAWGSYFGDFDLDGEQDLYVANGMITGKDPKPYSFRAATLMTVPGFFIMDARNWPPLGDLSWSGRQVDCLFLNRGGVFENVSASLGPNIPWDGRAVAGIDYDNNGSLDLVVTTQNESVHLLKNEAAPGMRWIGLHLVGVRSNRDGVGARLSFRQKNRTWYRWATGGRTGFLATSDPRIHVGLPDAEAVDVEVEWPSGIKQKLEKLTPGRYYEILESETP